MAITGTDSMGSFVDTGVSVQPTPRPADRVEFHSSLEVDSGSKLAPTSTLIASHIPHRGKDSPR